MKYEVKFTSRFKKDLKNIRKRNLDMERFWNTIEMLANGVPLPEECYDHKLIGNYNGVRECHIRPNWLLIYKPCEEVLVLELLRTGSHSDLF